MPQDKQDGSVEDRFEEGRLTRIAAGIWKDKKTGKKIAGGAYDPDTGAGKMMSRALRKGDDVEELEEAREELEE